jgi:hypothetical protein
MEKGAFSKKNKKIIFLLLLLISFSTMSFIVYKEYNMLVPDIAFKTPENLVAEKSTSTFSVSSVVEAAESFMSLLTTTQISTLQHTYTSTLAKKWSNLPCGSSCRNGIQFSTLTTSQLAAAKAVIQTALGTASNQGYDLFKQILLADDYLNTSGGGSGYGAGLYFISFLNEPSATGAWMLQFGGHHMAFNIAFNNGNVVGTTPVMLGVEPTSFTTNSVTYTPLSNKHDAMASMIASLTTAQLASAKLTTTFSDCLMSPGESNGNTNTMPSTKQGVSCSGFTTAQQALVLAAIESWVDDMDSDITTELMEVYTDEINSTYIAWTGSGTSGSASTFLNANTNYVRIDGPSVWIEFVCQNGVIFPAQIHYHTVWRDHLRDYGADLTNTSLSSIETTTNSVQSVKLYPNPTTEVLNIETTNALDNASIDVYNVSGRRVASVTNVSGTTVTLSVNNFATGSYIIRISEGHQSFTAKFIKK